LSRDGTLDGDSRIAQKIGRRYGIPVFLKTFGTDVAYAIEQSGSRVNVYVSQDMTRRMAQMPNVSGAAWSPDDTNRRCSHKDRRPDPCCFRMAIALPDGSTTEIQ